MRVESQRELGAVDLAPLLDLVPFLLAEARRVEFAPSGEALNPVTGQPTGDLMLLGGTPGTVGARYQLLRQLDPTQGDARAAPVNVDDLWRLSVAVTHDDPDRLDLTIAADRPGAPGQARSGGPPPPVRPEYEIQVAFHHERWPRGNASVLVHGANRSDSRGHQGRPSAWRADADLDLGALASPQPAQLLDARGSEMGVRVSARVTTALVGDRWRCVIDVRAKPRWWLRPFLALFRPGLEPMVQAKVDELWADVQDVAGRLEGLAAALPRLLGEHGGPEPLVRWALWDPDVRIDGLTVEK